MTRLITTLCVVFGISSPALADEVVLAVASNFFQTALDIAEAFEAETGHTVVVEQGATGLLFAQIGSGAPFDILLAADTERPARLIEDGLAAETATYAIGSLSLVSRRPVTAETASDAFVGQRVVLADPILAPYGKAATTAMERLGLDTATFQPLLVANVGQVASVFANGDAEMAFVASSSVAGVSPEHVLDLDGIAPSLIQDGALLSPGEPAALELWAWILSDAGRGVIEAAGYQLP